MMISNLAGVLELTEDEHVFPPWSDLPSPAIENIYSFLNRKDQKNMSLVCRNWREEYSSPSLWRNVTFSITDIKNDTDMCSNVIFARRYGAMFRRVEIFFPEPPPIISLPLSSAPDANLGQLISFMEAVTRHSQLISISFKYMLFNFRSTHEGQPLADVCQKILTLLKSQKSFQFVEFLYPRFKKADAKQILKVIFENNSNTLRQLILPGFVEERKHEDFEGNAVTDDLNYTVLRNLEELEIDYNQIFVNMILSFYEYRNRVHREGKGRLKRITLICNGYNVVKHLGIQSLVWKYLTDIFPGLTITLSVSSTCDPVHFSTFIVPGMPLRALFLTSVFRFMQVMQIHTLLCRITSCKINEFLEVLKIVWKGDFLNLAPDLIIFANICPELKALYLDIEHPVAGLDTVLQSWLENRPLSLQTVKVTVRRAWTQDDKAIYSNLFDFYTPLLQPLGMSLSFGA